jgi:hypothetical protein
MWNHELRRIQGSPCARLPFQADVFSFGIVLYELLHQRLLMATLIAQQIEDRHLFENEIMEFTKVHRRVRGG